MSRVLSVFDSIIVSNDKLYCFESKDLALSVIDISSDVKSGTSFNKPAIIDCFNISPCKKWLVVCFSKELRLFYNFQYHSSAAIDKSAIKVLFFNTEKTVLVADRSGGVYFYDFSANAVKKMNQAMGHNSMLTDALISSNDQYIITSDRDEKIRVSCYPNVYNIQSFCMGHEQFVSSISFLPMDENILVSSSGDGTIRLWDFKAGHQLLSYSEPKKENSIVKAVCISEKRENLIVVQFFKSDELSILSVSWTNSRALSIEKKSVITMSNLIDFSPFRNAIICLTETNPKLHLLNITEGKDALTQQFVLSTADSLTNVKLTSNMETFNIMFKREYDNVLEYQEKKKLLSLLNGFPQSKLLTYVRGILSDKTNAVAIH